MGISAPPSGSVDLSALITKATADAQSVLGAIADNTPVAIPVSASRLFGRKASGDVGPITIPEARALLGVSMSMAVLTAGSPLAWTNMPAALTEFDNTTRRRNWADLSLFTEVRLIANVVVAGAAGSKLRLMYHTTDTAFSGFLTIGTSDVEVAIDASNGLAKSAWVPLVAGAKADVIVTVAGIAGDATADPSFSMITAQFRSA